MRIPYKYFSLLLLVSLFVGCSSHDDEGLQTVDMPVRIAIPTGNMVMRAYGDPGTYETDRKSTRLNSQSRQYLVCRLLLEKKKKQKKNLHSINENKQRRNNHVNKNKPLSQLRSYSLQQTIVRCYDNILTRFRTYENEHNY